MKAITLHQPWATLIADGRKTSETRSWAPPDTLLGKRLAIHAGRIVDRHYAAEFGYDPDKLPLGMVVCTAVLSRYGVVHRQNDAGQVILGLNGQLHAIRWDQYGNYKPGRRVWMLTDVRKLDVARPARGRQGLWDWSEHTKTN